MRTSTQLVLCRSQPSLFAVCFPVLVSLLPMSGLAFLGLHEVPSLSRALFFCCLEPFREIQLLASLCQSSGSMAPSTFQSVLSTLGGSGQKRNLKLVAMSAGSEDGQLVAFQALSSLWVLEHVSWGLTCMNEEVGECRKSQLSSSQTDPRQSDSKVLAEF